MSEFLHSHFARVQASFRSPKENELSINAGDIVIIRTLDLSGWCYAESLDGQKGYIPFLYVIPILPQEEYQPAWKGVIHLRNDPCRTKGSIREIRKDLVAVQRRSIIKAQRAGMGVRSVYVIGKLM